ncbi:MAG TPA: prepilin-type N-terminal cleavage/methylation domain-containing protein [Acidobacteriota bacterium]|nr:prepilin-type N-terminal cleavage/methylation domain-containing protein [Acidobacteriota bacterium]
MSNPPDYLKAEGFSLTELMIALIILTFGLLSSGQLLCYAIGLESLSRSKGAAAVAAQDTLETLSALYRTDPRAGAFVQGDHGPKKACSKNPVGGSAMNCFNITWTVSPVPDSRPMSDLKAARVIITAAPVTEDGIDNRHPYLNKQVSIAAIFSPRWKD